MVRVSKVHFHWRDNFSKDHTSKYVSMRSFDAISWDADIKKRKSYHGETTKRYNTLKNMMGANIYMKIIKPEGRSNYMFPTASVAWR